MDETPEGLWEVDFFSEKEFEKSLILPAAHGQLEKTNLGWHDLAFGMSSGASAVYGLIRLGELVPTNKFSRPHLLWHARIFKKNINKIDFGPVWGSDPPEI